MTGQRNGDLSAKEQLDTHVSLDQKFKDLYALIDELKVCMMTTQRADGELVSRAMWTTDHERDGSLLFFTNDDAHKCDEIEQGQHVVNLAFLKNATGEYASISGHASIDKDRSLIKKHYTSSLKAWLGDLGDGKRDGSENDPRIAVIRVTLQSVHYYLKNDHSKGRSQRIEKSEMTGKIPHTHTKREISSEEAASLKA